MSRRHQFLLVISVLTTLLLTSFQQTTHAIPPPPLHNTIFDVLASHPKFSKFTQFLASADSSGKIRSALQDPEQSWTVIVPSNKAFEKYQRHGGQNDVLGAICNEETDMEREEMSLYSDEHGREMGCHERVLRYHILTKPISPKRIQEEIKNLPSTHLLPTLLLIRNEESKGPQTKLRHQMMHWSLYGKDMGNIRARKLLELPEMKKHGEDRVFGAAALEIDGGAVESELDEDQNRLTDEFVEAIIGDAGYYHDEKHHKKHKKHHHKKKKHHEPALSVFVNDFVQLHHQKSYHASNGFIYTVDEILLPPGKLLSTMSRTFPWTFSTTVDALHKSGLLKELMAPSSVFSNYHHRKNKTHHKWPGTLFLPSNSAWEKIPADKRVALFNSEWGHKLLAKILAYHCSEHVLYGKALLEKAMGGLYLDTFGREGDEVYAKVKLEPVKEKDVDVGYQLLSNDEDFDVMKKKHHHKKKKHHKKKPQQTRKTLVLDDIATVQVTDVLGLNGVAHVIDTVLMPPSVLEELMGWRD